jgi:hypothetical protein
LGLFVVDYDDAGEVAAGGEELEVAAPDTGF